MHAAIFEKIIGDGAASSLAAAAINAGFVGEDIPKHVTFFNGNPYENPYSDQKMAELYNIADVNISTTLGEGVGLSLIEASACGTTSIAPNNSAIPEMLGDTGHIVKNSAHITMAIDNNLVRPVVSVLGVINALEIEHQKWLANGRKKVVNMEAIQRVSTLFNWDEKRALLSGWLKEL